MTVFALVVQNAVAVVFFVAGLAKTVSYPRFRSAVAAYELLPAALVPVVARVVPVGEVLIAGALVADVVLPVAVAGAVGALMLFAVAMAVNLVRGREIDCGCGGGSRPRPVSWRLVLRNVVLAAALVATGLIISASSRSFLDARLPTLLAATAVVMAAAAGRMGATVWRHPSVFVKRAVTAS